MQAETGNRSSRGEPKDEVVPLQVGVTWSYGLGLAFYIAYLEVPHKRSLLSKTTAAMLRAREFGILGAITSLSPTYLATTASGEQRHPADL